jgi:hypothetical protein
VSNKVGWWNTIAAGDFRHTGKMDYILGNTGLNTFYQASDAYPIGIIAKDFDKNGSYAAIPSIYLPNVNGDKKEFPALTRDDILKQMISLKRKFTNYRSFATATMDDILSPEQQNGALKLTANSLKSVYLKNDGNGTFTSTDLPMQAQVSALNGITVDDFDGDGNLDVIINGNDYGTEVSTGRYDALNGLLLKGNGKGDFTPLSILQSGIYIPGNGKALAKLQGADHQYLLAASQNKDAMKLFSLKRKVNTLKLQPFDESAIIKYKNGLVLKQEFYYGSSFLSQSGRFINIEKNMLNVIITDSKGVRRIINTN